MDTHVYLTAYGNKGHDQGIIELLINSNDQVIKHCFQLDGKSNMVVDAGDQLITCVQELQGNFLLFFSKSGVLVKRVQTNHFYSYGSISNDSLLLASFEEGLDSSYHLKTGEWHTSIHHREGATVKGRSHYIKRINDKIIAVDNAYQQLYVYDDETLKEVQVVDFENGLNNRLLSYDAHKGLLFLNTELSNELLVLQASDLKVIKRIKITENRSCFSGGNVYYDKGQLICISMRCENMIYCFRNDDHFPLVHKIPTKKMPRDLKIIEDRLYVTCSDDHCVEVFSLIDFKKINEIEVYLPVTFSM